MQTVFVIVQEMALARVTVPAAVRKATWGSPAAALPVPQLVLALMMWSCAVNMVNAGVAFAYVRTTQYAVAPTVNCVQ